MGLKATPLPSSFDDRLRTLDALYARFTTHTREFRDEDNQYSSFVPFVLERLGMQIFEHYHAKMKYRPELNRWTNWDAVETRHEYELVEGSWQERTFQVG